MNTVVEQVLLSITAVLAEDEERRAIRDGDSRKAVALDEDSEGVIDDWCNGKTRGGEDRMRLLYASPGGVDSLPYVKMVAFRAGVLSQGTSADIATLLAITYVTGETPYC